MNGYRLEVDVEFVEVGIGIQAFDIFKEAGITVEEVRPGDGHGGAELAGADVEETLAAARVSFVDHAEARVVRVLLGRVEHVRRRSEPQTCTASKSTHQH